MITMDSWIENLGEALHSFSFGDWLRRELSTSLNIKARNRKIRKMVKYTITRWAEMIPSWNSVAFMPLRLCSCALHCQNPKRNFVSRIFESGNPASFPFFVSNITPPINTHIYFWCKLVFGGWSCEPARLKKSTEGFWSCRKSQTEAGTFEITWNGWNYREITTPGSAVGDMFRWKENYSRWID